MNLRTRLGVFTVLIIGSVIALTSASTVYLLKKLLYVEIQNNQKTLLNNFKKVCEEALATHDDFLLLNYIDSLKKTAPGFVYATFVDTDRQLIVGKTDVFTQIFPNISQASFLREGAGPGDVRRQIFRSFQKNEIIDLATDVQVEAQKFGVARIGIYKSYVDESVKEGTYRIQKVVLVVALASFFVGLMGALGMASQLSRPIALLAQGAKALGDGNLDTRIEFKRDDEIGLLAEEFNIMALKLKELDQLKDDFVSSVSHELRSPLSAIAGYVELLMSKPIEQITAEKRNKAFNIIQESTTRLTQFINDILDLAKIKSGRVEIRRTSFDVKQAADEVFGLYAPLFEKKRIHSYVYVTAGLPIVPADEEKVKQVITNLVSNAIKFTPEEGAISISAQDGPKDLTVSISDTGIGIPQEYLTQVFERFKQVPGSKDKIGGVKGTGLGLAIAKGIIESHGGRIWAESEPGKGSTFRFSLPKTAVEMSTQSKIF